MTRWFTSDTHFGHANIIKYSGRPWNDPEEMNLGLIDRWNSVVRSDDEVYHLGDVVMNMKYLECIQHLNGTIHLVAGNHDVCWRGNKKGVAAALGKYIEAGFATIFDNGIVEDFCLANGQRVTLSHFPYVGNEHDGKKFEGWRPINRGQINICGHVHDAWSIKDRSINVGVDVWNWTPINEETLIKTIKDSF